MEARNEHYPLWNTSSAHPTMAWTKSNTPTMKVSPRWTLSLSRPQLNDFLLL